MVAAAASRGTATDIALGPVVLCPPFYLDSIQGSQLQLLRVGVVLVRVVIVKSGKRADGKIIVLACLVVSCRVVSCLTFAVR